MNAITKAFSADVSVADGERAVSARISTIAVDRDGEVLIPQGCNAKEFQANPLVLFGHDYYSLPVGKITALKRDDSSVTAKIVFAERPATHPVNEEWMPDTLFSLYQQKVMNAFSVGFNIIEARPATPKDVTNFGPECRRVISKWKLLELSCVPLPCNQEAVAMAVSKGIVSPEMAKGVWGVEAERGEKPPEAPATRRIVAAISVAPPPPVPSVQPKRIVCYVPTVKRVDVAAQVRNEVKMAVAKASGRLYLIP